MTHQHKEKEENYESMYYIVGLLSGLFTGLVLDSDLSGYRSWVFLAYYSPAFSLSFWLRAVKTPDPDLPPFIPSWNQFYGIVIGWLILLILVFWLVTISFE